MPDLLAGKELDVLIGRLVGWKYPNHRHVRFEDGGSGFWVVWVSDAEQPSSPEQEFDLWKSCTPLLKGSSPQ